MQVLLRGSKNSREAVKHFGKAPGVPHSHTKPWAKYCGCPGVHPPTQCFD
ncbi:putative ribosomal protein L18e [Helianthus annuus]|nr:putative ribosomal protein L18e [Helianthus annuus]